MDNTENLSDIYNSVKPLLNITKLFGLSHFSFTNKNKNRYEELRCQLLNVSLLVLWISGVASVMCYNVYVPTSFALHIPQKLRSHIFVMNLWYYLRTSLF
jgi:hypothetical protein